MLVLFFKHCKTSLKDEVYDSWASQQSIFEHNIDVQYFDVF